MRSKRAGYYVPSLYLYPSAREVAIDRTICCAPGWDYRYLQSLSPCAPEHRRSTFHSVVDATKCSRRHRRLSRLGWLSHHHLLPSPPLTHHLPLIPLRRQRGVSCPNSSSAAAQGRRKAEVRCSSANNTYRNFGAAEPAFIIDAKKMTPRDVWSQGTGVTCVLRPMPAMRPTDGTMHLLFRRHFQGSDRYDIPKPDSKQSVDEILVRRERERNKELSKLTSIAGTLLRRR
jgi:hypothetical protein